MCSFWGTEGSNPSPSAIKILKLLALDYGLKRVGVAVGDTDLKIAMPECVLENNAKLKEKIVQMVKSKNVEKVIVGLPLTPSGKEGERAKKVREFVKELKELLPHIPVEMHDERYTTQEALRRLIGVNSKKKKKILDAISAQIILEEYIQSL